MVTPANLGVPVHNVLSVVFCHALAGVLSIAVVCLQCGDVVDGNHGAILSAPVSGDSPVVSSSFSWVLRLLLRFL